MGVLIMRNKIKIREAEVFFKQMEAFNFGFMQDVRTFINSLKNKGITLDHAISCIELRQGKFDKAREQDKKDRDLWTKKAKRCPNCGQILQLKPVNSPEGPGNVKGYKSIWFCSRGWEKDDPKEWCGYHTYSNLTLNQIFKKMRIKTRVRE
jgi:hypothetical protein